LLILKNYTMSLTLMQIEETDSTNSYLRRLVESGEGSDGLFLRADYQEAGRGRGEHSWISSRGKNLLFSWLTYPAFLSASRQFQLSKLVSVALARVLERHLQGVSLKWPNDLLVGGKKIGGVLIEVTLSGSAISHMICGIGLNINEEAFPAFERPATSFFLETGQSFSVEELYKAFASEIWELYLLLREGGDAEIDAAYLNLLYRRGIKSLFESGELPFSGVITGVDSYGQLCVDKEDGTKAVYAFGEISLLQD